MPDAPRPPEIDFDEVYRTGHVPWDIGEPQPALAELVVAGWCVGSVLDVGCGTGELGLSLAALGHRVTGVDLAPRAIELARAKAAERGLDVRWTRNSQPVTGVLPRPSRGQSLTSPSPSGMTPRMLALSSDSTCRPGPNRSRSRASENCPVSGVCAPGTSAKQRTATRPPDLHTRLSAVASATRRSKRAAVTADGAGL